MLNINTGHTFSCYEHIQNKNNCFTALAALVMNLEKKCEVDFQGWSKITLKIKMAHISFFFF